jgi:hypothetical protein
MKWEYLVKGFGGDKSLAAIEATANELGRDGWELASASQDGTFLTLIFKRPL